MSLLAADPVREQLLALRRPYLGASDCAAVLGLSPFKTALQVWSEKRGLVEPEPQNEAMYWGTVLEPVVADRYAAEHGCTLWNPERVYHHETHDWLVATPDRLIVGENKGVEIKTSSAYKREEWGRPRTDEVPAYYVVQCLVYMAVLKIPAWDVANLNGGNSYADYSLRFDAALWADMERSLCAWWQRHMIEGHAPEAVAADLDFLKRRFPRSDGDLLPASAEAFQLAMTRKMAAHSVKEHESVRDDAEAKLKALIGDADGITDADKTWRVTWKSNKASTVTDWEAVALAAGASPGLIALHTTEKPGARVFRYWEAK